MWSFATKTASPSLLLSLWTAKKLSTVTNLTLTNVKLNNFHELRRIISAFPSLLHLTTLELASYPIVQSANASPASVCARMSDLVLVSKQLPSDGRYMIYEYLDLLMESIGPSIKRLVVAPEGCPKTYTGTSSTSFYPS
ncbi:hypothetical protein DAEQUDRAFT_738556 [Daedalea quercina L-15889]|uniref:F-box domain-containing protein n=1 Tax=Daedalea quercina L-15889 TaxID=1314783 RepID=A0A165PVJ7_9APHY|nr:hypothetical protein DAEQUDRAFT_738556 [Daedalea quercina L-15889]